MSDIVGTYTLTGDGWRNASIFSSTSFQPSAQFFERNGEIVWQRPNTCADLKTIYEKCAPLSSILNRKAKAFASGNLEVLNANTDNYVRGKYKEWETLLNNPNPLQSKRQYFRQQYLYTYINGFSLALKIKSVGFGDVPTKLWALPYWCIEVEDKHTPVYNLKKEDLLKGVYFVYGGKKTLLNPDDLILFTDENGDLDPCTWLPKSRIIQLQYPITTQLSAVEAEVTMIQKKGALGILSNKATDQIGHVAMSPKEKQELQNEFRRYGLSRDQWQYIITTANLEWQSMTFPTKELMLHESDEKAYKMMCDGFEFPYELTAMSDRKNLSNVKTFDTILYQNAIIPEADAFDEQLMTGLNALDNNIKIRHDYSHIPALQQSEEEKGKGRKAMNEALQLEWNNGLITKNMWLKEIGRDEVTGNEAFNKYKFELTPEELGIIEQDNNNSNNKEKEK